MVNGFSARCGAARSGCELSRRILPRAAAILASVLLCVSTPAAADGPSPHGAAGKLVVKGRSLVFTRAWLVRGADTFDKAKPSAYLILSAADLSAAIAACKDLSCVLWDTVRDGAILQPVNDGHESFWLRVVSPRLPREEQLSGRSWKPLVDRHDRLAGRLQFSYSNTRDEADLEIDAALAREFPVESDSKAGSPKGGQTAASVEPKE